MPSASVTHTAPVPSGVESAWASLQSASTWERIGPIREVHDVVHDPDGTLASFRWSTEVGGKVYTGTAKRVDADPLHRFALLLDTSELSGRITVELTSGDAPSTVTVTIDMSTKGLLSTMFFPAIKQALANGLPAQVDELAATL